MVCKIKFQTGSRLWNRRSESVIKHDFGTMPVKLKYLMYILHKLFYNMGNDHKIHTYSININRSNANSQ